MDKKLTVGSCFSGIGGLELGLEWTGGFETRWQIEIDPYATKVLEKHWPKVKRYKDIRNPDITGMEWVDLICGGYPCQPFSVAGKREGELDPRHLWPHMFGIIGDLRPTYVLLENVPGHLSLGFGRVLGDLASIGYDAEWGVLSAAGVGAPHLRRRIFILAYTGQFATWNESDRFDCEQFDGSKTGIRTETRDRPPNGGQTLADAKGDGMEGRKAIPQKQSEGEGIRGVKRSSEDVANTARIYAQRFNGKQGERESWRSSWWSVEPDVGRVAHGVPSRVDRLKCLGNAVVPQVAQKIGEMILNHAHLRRT
jgi:DNA (cytosine-5)-methyltransferase 1